jgi:hypothetical protein
MSDIVLMEGRGFGFVTYTDPQCAQAFLEVSQQHPADWTIAVEALHCTWAQGPTRLGTWVQKKDHELDHKKIEAKAAVPKNAGGSSGLTRKMFVGGTVRFD